MVVPPEPVPLIALLTDFGLSEYVGVLKGVIASLWEDARIVDLCHTVRPQDVREGAWILRTTYRYFPPGTLFVAVVDPGVGSDRAAVAVESRHYRWVGPDNGLLFPAVEDDGGLRVVNLPVPPEASNTFHGRDVFAPAAARWAAGTPLESLGEARLAPLVPLRFYHTSRRGEVVRVDAFGNLVTPVPPPQDAGQPGRPVTVALLRRSEGRWRRVGRPVTARWVRTYADAPDGTLVVLVGSAGTLEVSRVAGSAAEVLGARSGDRLIFRFS